METIASIMSIVRSASKRFFAVCGDRDDPDDQLETRLYTFLLGILPCLRVWYHY